MSITTDHPNETLIPASGDLTITGNLIISGLTASSAVSTDASKRLISAVGGTEISLMFEAALVY